MKYYELCITTKPEALEDLEARLVALDVPGFQIDDEEEFRTFLEENRKYWDYVDDELLKEMEGKCQIKVYLPCDEQGKQLKESVEENLPILKKDRPDIDFGPLKITTVIRDEEDWQGAWKQYYKPIKTGEKLLIVPEWELNDTIDFEGRTVLVSNPGMAFGTGTHATTRLCLEILEDFAPQADHMLDLGCGSGILSIAALLLGTKEAIGIDIDQAAADTAMKNAEMNGVQDRYTTYNGDVLSDESMIQMLRKNQYDLITANIVADVIIPMTPMASSLLKDGGKYIVSGIIDYREKDVLKALKDSGMSILKICRDHGWVAILAENDKK